MTHLGEWWIEESGHVEFADGNVGDDNHETLALRSIRARLIGNLGADCDEYDDPTFYAACWEFVQEEYDLPALEDDVDAGESPSIIREHVERYMKENCEDELNLVIGSFDYVGLREFVIKHFGWIRVADKRFSMRNMGSKDELDNLRKGLGEILEQSGIEDEDIADDDYIEIDDGGRSFCINVKDVLNGDFSSLQPTSNTLAATHSDQVKQMDVKAMSPVYAGRIGD